MLAIWASIVLIVAALAAAMTLGWRRHVARPEPVQAKIEGPTCYPKVRR